MVLQNEYYLLLEINRKYRRWQLAASILNIKKIRQQQKQC
jgi:hypothetical protein